MSSGGSRNFQGKAKAKKSMDKLLEDEEEGETFNPGYRAGEEEEEEELDFEKLGFNQGANEEYD